jgi:hypothetical protein
MDNAGNKSYGTSISMVLGCGQKPSGEEVIISLFYALGLHTDKTFHLALKTKNLPAEGFRWFLIGVSSSE